MHNECPTENLLGDTPKLTDDLDTVTKVSSGRVYNPSPKHHPIYGWGTPNPIPDIPTGQKLLDNAYDSVANKQLYNIYNGQIIKFQPDTVDGWHAYAVSNVFKEVPNDVLKKMLADNLITRSQYNKLKKNKKK